MKLDCKTLDELSAQAKKSPRLRMNMDLRNSPEDSSQRMLNAMEPGTVLPIHRHLKSSETVVVLRGKIRQNFYDRTPEGVTLIDSFECFPGGENMGFCVPVGCWHNTVCLEPDTVILECKDGKYEPLSKEEVMELALGER